MIGEFLAVSRCLNCDGELVATPANDALDCRKCDFHVSIRGGVPRFVPGEDYTSSFGLQWRLHARTQLDRFNGLNLSRERLLNESGWAPSALKGQRVLECGSG